MPSDGCTVNVPYPEADAEWCLEPSLVVRCALKWGIKTGSDLSLLIDITLFTRLSCQSEKL